MSQLVCLEQKTWHQEHHTPDKTIFQIAYKSQNGSTRDGKHSEVRLGLKLTVVLNSIFRKIILPESVFVLSVLEPQMRVFVNDQVSQVVIVEDFPRYVVRDVWCWIPENATARSSLKRASQPLWDRGFFVFAHCAALSRTTENSFQTISLVLLPLLPA